MARNVEIMVCTELRFWILADTLIRLLVPRDKGKELPTFNPLTFKFKEFSVPFFFRCVFDGETMRNSKIALLIFPAEQYIVPSAVLQDSRQIVDNRKSNNRLHSCHTPIKPNLIEMELVEYAIAPATLTS